MKKILTLIISLVMLCCTACSNTTQTKEDDKLQVYTSFYAMYDIARQIGGDKAEVYLMCPVGTEPHDYEPKTTDIAKLSEADVFVYNGGGMESWAEKVVSSLKDVKVVCASDGVEKAQNSDPHIWLNPNNAVKEAENILNAFSESDPENKAFYETNFNSFKDKAAELDKEYKAVSETAAVKDIIVAHAAYGYLCQAYGFEQIAVENAQSTEPSPARMAEIVDIIKEKGIKYICSEELESAKMIQAIADETGVGVVTLNPFEGDKDNKDYFTVMHENLDVLKVIFGI